MKSYLRSHFNRTLSCKFNCCTHKKFECELKDIKKKRVATEKRDPQLRIRNLPLNNLNITMNTNHN